MKEGEKIKINIGGIAVQKRASGASPGAGTSVLLPPPPVGGVISFTKPLDNNNNNDNITVDDEFGDFEGFS